MNARTKWMREVMILAVGAIGFAFTLKVSAQATSSTEESAGQATYQVKVERAEVLAVYGNDLILKAEDGSIRHIANVPETARATVDGREIGIHDVQPGMILQKTVITTTTPKVITTTQSVTGTVWYVNPPSSVILTLENGQNKHFNIPKGQKFTVNGEQTDAWGLRKGMKVSATKVIEQPVTEVEEQARLTGRMPPPPPALPADEPILVEVAEVSAPPAAPAAPAAQPELPKTGSDLPLVGLLGFLMMTGSLFVWGWRKVHA